MKLKYFASETLTPEYVAVLKSACRSVFPDGVQLFPVSNPFHAQMILSCSDTEEELVSVFQHYINLVPWPGHDHETLYFDIETDSEELRWNMPVEKFFRLGQYSWGISGEVHVTTDLGEMRALIRRAYGVVGHNIHSFDLSVLLSDEALLLPRVFDTMVHAGLVNPAPYMFTMRSGHTYYDGMKPEKALKWLSLDNQCFALGLTGKIGDLKELAKKHGGFGSIPLDDPEYLEYAIGDILALQELTTALLEKRPIEAYDWREQVNAAIDAQSTRNGFTVDIPKAQARVDELQAEKDALLAKLQSEYNFPTQGTQPWRSNPGKEAIFRILEDNGITLRTRPDWTRTATGNLSLGGEVLLELTEGTAAESLGRALATLMGQRSLAALALASVQDDGKAHPQITALQRSGRKCVPTSHRILTRRGLLTVDQVRPGDQTLDVYNEWTDITDVHRYANQPTLIWGNSRESYEATAEHRWVQTPLEDSRWSIEPLVQGSRKRLKLTPETYFFDLSEHRRYPLEMSPSEKFAAFVGLLVTDGRCAIRSDTGGITAHVYQTTHKFYREMMSVVPKHLVVSDTYRAETDHHDVRFSASAVKRVLSDNGLVVEGNLRRSPLLLPWVLGLTQRECLAFLCSVWLADGTTAADKGVSVSCKNDILAECVMVAAYRCGYRPVHSYYNNATGRRAGVIRLRLDRVTVKNLAPTPSNSDVWCVTTGSGTWTAWNENGPYLTGNSTTKPGLTVWSARGDKAVEKSYFIASPGRKLIEFDFSNADSRVVAAYSGDKEFAKRLEPGADGHDITGELFFGHKAYYADRENLRPLAKVANHALAYRIGKKKLSHNMGVTEDEAYGYILAYQRGYPDVARWQDEVTRIGERGYVTNKWGRRMIVDPDRSFTQSAALLGQSGTREIMVDGLIRLLERDPRYIRYLVAQIHDAIVMDVPEAEVDEVVAAVVECMETEWNGIAFPMAHGEPADDWMRASHG